MALGSARRIGAAFAAVWLLAGCSSPEERFAHHVERANELTAEGDLDAAVIEYLSALKIDAANFDANRRMGELLVELGDPNGAFYLEQAHSLDPDNIDVAVELATVLMLTDRKDEARKLIESYRSSHPDSAKIFGAESELRLFENDAEGALRAALQATKIDPESSIAWMQLGRAYQAKIWKMQQRGESVKMKWYRDAYAAFERADDLAGGLVIARIEMGRTIGARIQRRAQEEFAAAIELAKEQHDPTLHMAAAGAAEDFAAEAGMAKMQIWALEEMLEADSSRLDLWQRLARLSASVGKPDDAIYAALLEKRPDDPGAHVLYAEHLADQDRVEDAVAHLQGVIERDPDSPAPWEQLVRLQIHLLRFNDARDTFVRMWKKFPEDPLTRQASARLALASGRFDDAAKILRGLAARSKRFDLQRLLALAEYRTGNLEESVRAIDQALEQSPDFPVELVRFRAQVLHDERSWIELLRTLSRLAKHGATMMDSDWLMRARALYNIGRPGEGRAALLHVLSKPNPQVAAAIEFARWEGERQPETASQYLLDALEREPENPTILEALVDLDLRAGKPEQALSRINASFDAGHAVPRTVLLRARVQQQRGVLDAAEADALRALDSNPAVRGGLDLLYAIYEQQGRLDEALASFEAADAAGVLKTGGRLFLGRLYARKGVKNRAAALYEKTLADDPTLSIAKRELAYLLAEGNRDLDRALQLAREAQQSMGSDAEVTDTVGFVYLRKGMNEQALEQFRRAVELSKDQPTALEPMLNYHLGLSLAALDRNEEAADAFRRALAIDPDFRFADDARRRIEAASQAVTARPSPS